MVNAHWISLPSKTIFAAIAEIRGDSNMIPVETIALIVIVDFLPGAVIQNANSPFSDAEIMLFLAGNFADLATRAIFIIYEKAVGSHLVHQLSKFLFH